MEKSCLSKLKEDYSKFQVNYGLPGFEDLNKEFGVEKLAEHETDFLIREIRRVVADKLSSYLQFIEAIINPSNAPIFVLSMVKTLGEDEKTRLSEVYKRLALFQVKFIKIDLDFDEGKEVECIKDSYALWKEIRQEIGDVVDVILKNWDNKFEPNNRGYFG